jgi:hypothetical protein
MLLPDTQEQIGLPPACLTLRMNEWIIFTNNDHVTHQSSLSLTICLKLSADRRSLGLSDAQAAECRSRISALEERLGQ